MLYDLTKMENLDDRQLKKIKKNVFSHLHKDASAISCSLVQQLFH